MPETRSTTQADADEELVAQLRSAVTRLARAQRAHGMQVHEALPSSLMAALGTLERHGPMTPTELAAAEGVRKPSMTRALASLEERGLVVRADDPDDRRQSFVEISKSGLRELRQTRRVIGDWYMERLEVLSGEELDMLRRALGALTRLAEEGE